MNLQNLNESPLAQKARERTQYFLEEILKVDSTSCRIECANKQGEELCLRYRQNTNALFCYTWKEYIDIFDLVGFLYSIQDTQEIYNKTMELLEMDHRAERNTTAVPELEASMHNPADCGGVPLNSTHQNKMAHDAADGNIVRTDENTTPVPILEPLMHNPADCGGGGATDGKNNNDMDIPTLADCIADIMANVKVNMNAPSVSTGISGLDHLFGGVLPEGVVTIGGHSGSGKSALVLQMVLQLAKDGRDVIYFNLEMTMAAVAMRLISNLMLQAAIARKLNPASLVLHSDELAKGIQFTTKNQTVIELYDQAYKDFCNYMKRIRIIDAHDGITVEDIKQKVEYITSKSADKRMPVVVIDYIQLIKPKFPTMTDKANMDHAISVLNAVSHSDKEHGGTTIFALSSLSKTGCDTLDINALKESNSLAYGSVAILMLNYAVVLDSKTKPVPQKSIDAAQQETPRKMGLSVLKNRNGPSGEYIRLDYFPQYNTFRDANK